MLRHTRGITIAALACLIASASLAHAHGGMAGAQLGRPIATSVALGFVCYWLVILWPSSSKKGDTEVQPGAQDKDATAAHKTSHKYAARVKRKPRLRKIEGNGQLRSDVQVRRKTHER